MKNNTNNTIEKDVLIRMLSLKSSQWKELKGQYQDVTQENFIDNVILVLNWVMNDVEKM